MKTFSKENIHAIFTAAAPTYSVMNDIMSLGLHRKWRQIFISLLPWRSVEAVFFQTISQYYQGTRPLRTFICIDMACGDGDITTRLVRHAEKCYKSALYRYLKNAIFAQHCALFRTYEPKFSQCFSLYGVDPNSAMQSRGGEIFSHPCVHKRTEAAESLSLQSQVAHLYTMVFGLRNIPAALRMGALHQAFRVLAPGGAFFCMEFSSGPTNPLGHLLYSKYLQLLPTMGEYCVGNRCSYEYLAKSIQDFPDPPTVCAWLQKAGFTDIGYRTLTGDIVAIYWGKKPPSPPNPDF